MADDEKKDEQKRITRLKRVHVFTCGDYGRKGNWPPERIDRMNSAYSPALEKAKVKKEHVDSGPKHGEITRIWREGQKVYADIANISKELSQDIVDGSYEDRSVEIFLEHATTKEPYWKGLAFLGAAPPQVKGMEPLQFTDQHGAAYLGFASEEDGARYVRMTLDEVDMSDTKKDEKKTPPAPAPVDGSGKAVTMSEDEVIEFREMKAEMKRLATENARLAAASRRATLDGRVESLKRMDGGPRILPKMEARLSALLMSMSNDTSVTFSGDDKAEKTIGQVDLLFSILEDMPPLVRMNNGQPTIGQPPVDTKGGMVTEAMIADQAFTEAKAKFPTPGDQQEAAFSELFEAKVTEAIQAGKLVRRGAARNG